MVREALADVRVVNSICNFPTHHHSVYIFILSVHDLLFPGGFFFHYLCITIWRMSFRCNGGKRRPWC